MPMITLIIVNYRSGHCLPECLTHVERAAFEGEKEVLVVNNSPGDGIKAMIARDFPWARTLTAPGNLGFGPANNLGFKEGRGDTFLLLNPDAYIPENALQIAYDYLHTHNRVGLVGCQFENDQGHRQPSARMLPTVLDKFFLLTGLAAKFPKSRIFGRMDSTWWNHAHPKQVDWTVGAFLMIKGSIVRKLGGFDPRFFLYFEEWDFCRRIKKSGSEVHYLPQVVVRHTAGASSENAESGEREGKQLTLLRLFAEALYYGKYYGRLGPWLMLGMERLWFYLRLVRNRKRDSPECRLKTKALELHLRQLKCALRTTRYGQRVPEHPWIPDLDAYE